MRAAAMTARRRAQFDVERLQLELRRIDREIAGAPARGGEALTELAARRARVQAQIDRAMEQVMTRRADRRRAEPCRCALPFAAHIRG